MYAGKRTRKNVTLDILWPDRNLFTRINCLWYSALNKANGVSSNGWRMCVQCGGKQHTLTFLNFMYSMNPKLKRCNLCMSSSNRTLLFPAKIFFSVKNQTKCSPNSWNSLSLIYPVADPWIIYPVGTASRHSGLILFILKILSGGIASLPALMHETIVVFCCFSPLTVWKVHSPVIPTTAVGCGTSPMPHSSTFHILFGV